ncbi:MAG: hypothetical protein ACRCYR_03305 [Phycicoccus sp.]
MTDGTVACARVATAARTGAVRASTASGRGAARARGWWRGDLGQ